MKKILSWQVALGVSLIVASALLYLFHYGLFGDAHHIFIYLVGDIAFVPIEVLLVTLILHKLLTVREKRALMEKMNMVIGAFYSEVGNEFIKRLSSFCGKREEIAMGFRITAEWSEEDLDRASVAAMRLAPGFDTRCPDMEGLRDFLSLKKDFMLRLLENPVLLEHDSFSDLLWATFHLTEELAARGDLSSLPRPDYEHLSGDMARVYGKLISEWLSYLKHLKKAYPFLYSLALRTNPLNPEASPVIKN